MIIYYVSVYLFRPLIFYLLKHLGSSRLNEPMGNIFFSGYFTTKGNKKLSLNGRLIFRRKMKKAISDRRT